MIPSLPTLEELREKIALPADTAAVFCSGSVALGWAHAHSDVDVQVVTQSHADVAASGIAEITLDTGTVPILVFDDSAPRMDIEFWTEAQIDEVLGRLRHPGPLDQDSAPKADPVVIETAARLLTAYPLFGAAWLERRRAELEASGLRTIVMRHALSKADGLIEDALGFLDVGDVESAVVTSREAFAMVVDAALADSQLFLIKSKWRIRQLRTIGETHGISAEEYWAVETAAGIHPGDAHAWVLATIERCRDVMLELDVA